MKSGYGKPETKYACVGYCFGAPYVCDQLAGDIVSAGAFAHPAFLKEHHFSQIKSKRLFAFQFSISIVAATVRFKGDEEIKGAN